MDTRDDTQHRSRTFLSWLSGACASAGRMVTNGQAPPVTMIKPAFAAPAAAAGHDAEPAGRRTGTETAVLLPFPIRGEALLVKLADLLRERVATHRFERDPLLLKISRCPGSRLSIDRFAYVEFRADRSAYNVVIEAAPDARITLDTTDFEAVVSFVAQYVSGRICEPVVLEAAR